MRSTIQLGVLFLDRPRLDWLALVFKFRQHFSLPVVSPLADSLLLQALPLRKWRKCPLDFNNNSNPHPSLQLLPGHLDFNNNSNPHLRLQFSLLQQLQSSLLDINSSNSNLLTLFRSHHPSQVLHLLSLE